MCNKDRALMNKAMGISIALFGYFSDGLSSYKHHDFKSKPLEFMA